MSSKTASASEFHSSCEGKKMYQTSEVDEQI